LVFIFGIIFLTLPLDYDIHPSINEQAKTIHAFKIRNIKFETLLTSPVHQQPYKNYILERMGPRVSKIIHA
jgi:hypothetical protein